MINSLQEGSGTAVDRKQKRRCTSAAAAAATVVDDDVIIDVVVPKCPTTQAKVDVDGRHYVPGAARRRDQRHANLCFEKRRPRRRRLGHRCRLEIIEN